MCQKMNFFDANMCLHKKCLSWMCVETGYIGTVCLGVGHKISYLMNINTICSVVKHYI